MLTHHVPPLTHTCMSYLTIPLNIYNSVLNERTLALQLIYFVSGYLQHSDRCSLALERDLGKRQQDNNCLCILNKSERILGQRVQWVRCLSGTQLDPKWIPGTCGPLSTEPGASPEHSQVWPNAHHPPQIQYFQQYMERSVTLFPQLKSKI